MVDIKHKLDSAYTLEKEGNYENAMKLFELIINHFKRSNEIYKVKYFEAKKIECMAKLLKKMENLRKLLIKYLMPLIYGGI